jgi:hypothetical protein
MKSMVSTASEVGGIAGTDLGDTLGRKLAIQVGRFSRIVGYDWPTRNLYERL